MITADGIDAATGAKIVKAPAGSAMKSNTVFLIRPKRFGDERGWFSETYNERIFERLGLSAHFVQDNQSFSRSIGTIRGLHFQRPPHAQAKLVRCVSGRIIDVVVDLRMGSPSFGKWLEAALSAEGGEQIFVPIGFAHGFVTLAANTEVIYKVTDFYAPEHDAGIRWNDPAIAIDWQLPKGITPSMSKKDSALPFLQELTSPFEFRSGDAPLEVLREIQL